MLALVITTQTLGFAGIAFGVRRRRGSLAVLGFKRPTGTTDYAIAAVIALAYCAIAAWLLPAVRTWAFRPDGLKILAVVAAVVAGVFEETFFRGCLMDFVQRRGGNAGIQVVTSALAFGLAHVVWSLAGTHRGWTALAAPLSTFVLGFCLAALYLKSGRSLGPVIVCHIAIDAIIEPGLLLAAMTHA